jgi:hypothetical protein
MRDLIERLFLAGGKLFGLPGTGPGLPTTQHMNRKPVFRLKGIGTTLASIDSTL